jgi:uncharacterized protein YbgA (DUF1722 family)
VQPDSQSRVDITADNGKDFDAGAYASHQWIQLQEQGVTHHELMQFWARYKYLVMAHHIASYKAIGPMLANGHGRALEELAEEFIQTLMAALNHPATRRSRTNVLQHLRGYLKRELKADEKREMDHSIEQYRVGKVPLIVPMTLLRDHFRDHQNDYIDAQVFLMPYSETLQLQDVV